MKFISFLIIAIAFADIFPQTGLIFPLDHKPEKVFGGGFFTEGPACGNDGCIYFSDQTFTDETDMQAGIIWKYDPVKDTTVVFRSPSGMSNGISFDREGNMVVCEGADFGGRRITLTDIRTGKSKIIVALYKGLPLNSPNDLTIDSKGRIYFTDPRYIGYEKIDQPVMGVYRIDNAKIKLLINDIPMPNGIALSPDEKTLYVGCNFEGDEYNKPVMAIYKYSFTRSDSVNFDKILVTFKDDSGPDGIKVDGNGNLFVAVRDESDPQIRVYTPEGKLIDYLNLPEVPGNLTFAQGEKEVYITAGSGLYRFLLK